jgi:NitT/TauT family transport system substrate-binding protein
MKRSLISSVVIVVAACLIAACGSDDDGGGGGSASGGGVTTEGIKVAYASALDPNDIADQFGLKEAGAQVQTLNEDSAVVAGLQRGDVDVGNIDFNNAIAAVSEGLPIKVIYISQRTPEFVLAARPEVATVADLAGKKVGFQEPGSQTEILARNIVEQQAPEIVDDVEFLALPESSRRAQAMAAGRLDASPIESINLAALQKEGDYTQLASWADLEGDASEVLGTAWITTEQYYSENKEQLTQFVKTLQKGYNRAYADKDAWVALAEQTLPDVDANLLPAVYDIYAERKMYPETGTPAITSEIFAANEEFFRSIDEWEEQQSDEMIAFDLVEAGSTETGETSTR